MACGGDSGNYTLCIELRSTAVCQADGRTGLHLTTAALAYACQIVTRIPSEAHDVRPDLVITEAALYGDT